MHNLTKPNSYKGTTQPPTGLRCEPTQQRATGASRITVVEGSSEARCVRMRSHVHIHMPIEGARRIGPARAASVGNGAVRRGPIKYDEGCACFRRPPRLLEAPGERTWTGVIEAETGIGHPLGARSIEGDIGDELSPNPRPGMTSQAPPPILRRALGVRTRLLSSTLIMDYRLLPPTLLSGSAPPWLKLKEWLHRGPSSEQRLEQNHQVNGSHDGKFSNLYVRTPKQMTAHIVHPSRPTTGQRTHQHLIAGSSASYPLLLRRICAHVPFIRATLSPGDCSTQLNHQRMAQSWNGWKD
ncbi:hypothetical protein LXA43DRAFT_1057808 [Ganoderma leucocontextum]|nr:hypothetical protein LXA43DRAFT_1057808 [Ganoderma leucocontextum]